MNAWKNHGQDIVSYVMGLLGLIATLTPDQLTQIFGARGPGVVVLIMALLNYVHGKQTNPPAPILPSAPKLFLYFFIACGLFFTSGCQTVPSTNTFNQSLLAAGTLDDTAINTLDSLIKSGAINSTQASAALEIVDRIQAGLNLANTTYLAGDVTGANAKLTAAASAISQLQGCLIGPKAGLLTCLQGVKVP